MLKNPLFTLGIIAFVYAAVAAVGLAGSVLAESSAPKSGERLLSIHDESGEKGILTRATTIRKAFEEAGIPFDSNDMVEPGLDETLVASNYDVNIYRARPVTIVDGSVRKKIMSAYRTPSQIAAHAGMKLQDEDRTTTSMPVHMAANGAAIELIIDRATPFTLVLYGKKTTAYTQTATVSEMLKEKGITVGKEDTLSVGIDTPITKGMTVEIWRNGVQTVTVDEEVAFGVEKIQDVDREVGYREVKTPGVPGMRTVTYEIEMRNGQEVSRKEIQSVTTKEPVKQVEVVGAKITNTFSGSFAEALARLRSCEGSYTSNTGNGYYGAYQFDLRTWGEYQGYPNAAVAPPPVQDQKAWETYQRRGWQPWPSCSRSMGLQDIYR